MVLLVWVGVLPKEFWGILADKDHIIKQRKEVADRVASYRKELLSSLYAECESLGGHEFYEWTDCSYVNVIGEFVGRKFKECKFCGYRIFGKE